jgi:PPP family 3-phenylpropionic acid transporter
MDKDKYSKIRVAGSVGFVATTLLIGLLSHSEFFQLSLLVGTSFFILLSGWLLIDASDHHADSIVSSPQSIDLWEHKYFWISMFVMQIAFGAYYNFFTIFASFHGFSNGDISFFWTLGVLCEIIMLLLQGSLFRFSLKSLIITATLLTSVRWIAIDLFPENITIIYLAQSLHSVGFALYHTATIALLFELYPNKRVAQQYYYGISFGLGGFLGAIIFGKIYGENIFLYASILTFISALVMFWHVKKEELSRE